MLPKSKIFNMSDVNSAYTTLLSSYIRSEQWTTYTVEHFGFILIQLCTAIYFTSHILINWICKHHKHVINYAKHQCFPLTLWTNCLLQQPTSCNVLLSIYLLSIYLLKVYRTTPFITSVWHNYPNKLWNSMISSLTLYSNHW